MRIGDTGRLLDLFECSPFHSERDIIEKCVVKKNRLLVDIPHQAAQIVQGRITHIRSVDRYAPLVHIIETRQQIHQRALSRPRLADQRYRVSFRNRQVNAFQHPFMLVLEPDIPVANTFRQSNRFRILRIVNIAFRLQDLIDAIHRGKPFLNGIRGLAKILRRIDYTVKNHQVVDESRGVDRTVTAQDQRTAIPQHDRDRGCPQELAHRMRHLLAAVNAVRQPPKRFVAFLKTVLYLRLRIESLDNTQATQRLLYLTHQIPPLLLSLERFPFQLLSDRSHHISGERQQDEDKKRQLPADGDHPDQVDQDQDRVFEEHIKRTHDRSLDLVHISRNACDYIPLPLFREKAQREFRYLAVDLIADVADDTRTDRDHRIKSHIHRPDLQESRHDQENTQYDQREGTAFRLDHVGHEPKEVVFQQFRSRFPGFERERGERPIRIGIGFVTDFKQDIQNRDD